MGKSEFELSTFLPYQLAVLSERVSKRLSVYYESEFGLSMAEWRVLVHLSRCPLVSVREIHNCVNLEKSRVSRAVSKLETQKMVQKIESKQDHRLVDISLTPKGDAVLTKILDFAQSFEVQLKSTISPENARIMETVFESLHRTLDDDPLARPRSKLDKLPRV